MPNPLTLPRLVTLVTLAAASPAFAFELQLNLNQRYQSIDGWGACTTTSDTKARQAYRDLGMNMLRVYANKNVLVKSSTDYATPVTLSTDMNANLAKMNFSTGGMDPAGSLAQWLSTNALEPSRVKINCDVWSPPHWMKGPTGVSQFWTGNDHAGNPLGQTTFPTPWLSNEHNGWGGYSHSGDSIGGRLKTEDPTTLQQYGYYMASWAKGFEKKYNVPVYSMNIQNESTFENPFDSMTLIKDQYGNVDYNQYALALQSVHNAWQQFGLTTKVVGPGTARVGDSPSNPYMLNHTMNMIQAVKNAPDPTPQNFLSIYGTNYYLDPNSNETKMLTAYWKGKQAVSDPSWAFWCYAPGVQNDGKPVWFTENSDGGPAWLDSTNNPGSGAITVALNIHNALVYANASAYEYWSFVSSGTSADASSLLGTGDLNNPTQSKKYDAFKQFSRYIRPGAQRIDASFVESGLPLVGGSDAYDSLHALNASAFIDDLDNTLTIVLINMESSSTPLTLDLPVALRNGKLQEFCTSDSYNFTQLADLTAVNNRVTFSMPGYSVLTLVGTPVPEPAALPLLAMGGILLLRRRR